MDLFEEFHKKLLSWYIKSNNSSELFFYTPYIHFDISPLPKSVKNIENSASFRGITKTLYDKISSPSLYVGNRKYNFLPLLRVEEKKYKFVNKSGGSNQRIKQDSGKVRPLTYCSNFEKILYTYYNCILENLYEEKVRKLDISNNVLAYRKIPKLKDESNFSTNKCNIEFANEAFSDITNMVSQHGKCTAIALDISGFFDNISHATIKKEWLSLFQAEDRLPINHWKVFESITKFSFIRKNLLLKQLLRINNRKTFKKSIFGYTSKSDKSKLLNPRMYGSLRIHNPISKSNLKLSDIIYRCKEYMKIPNDKGRYPVKKIFESNKQNFGIPQGLPLSGVISNISFISIDIAIKKVCTKFNAKYSLTTTKLYP